MKKVVYVIIMTIFIAIALFVVGAFIMHNINYQIEVYEMQVKDFESYGLKAPEPPFWYHWFAKGGA